MRAGLPRFGRIQAIDELHDIAAWWLTHSIDTQFGGFAGEIDNAGNRIAGARKGIILNSRILWFFSALCRLEENPDYRAAADRAFQYLIDRFDDEKHGGVFWELAANGAIVNSKKQVYAMCFCIYAFTAYYRLTANPLALSKSLQYFNILEERARDHQHGGYFEAFSRKWQRIADVRLGVSDMNAPKTMNTHLHLLEAYTALHDVAPTGQTEEALRNSIALFCNHIFDQDSGHLQLFFDTGWTSLSSVVSFGHDIEASWLLCEAAKVLADPGLIEHIKPVAVRLADSCQREGIGQAGQLCNEYDSVTNQRSEAGVWWVQAEALVGFLNAFKLTAEDRYRESCDRIWKYICDYQKDSRSGEWYWQYATDDLDVRSYYKAGFWKGPYHNGRAMMQACKLFDALERN